MSLVKISFVKHHVCENNTSWRKLDSAKMSVLIKLLDFYAAK